MKSIILLCSLILLLSPLPALAGLVIGVHPYLDNNTIVKRFKPLADYLSDQLDTKVEIRVGKDYDSHIHMIGRNNIDIAYMGPSSYVKLVETYGNKPILARLEAAGKPTFNGHIIVRDNSPLRQLSDLQNRFFAFGDKNSTMSRLVPEAMLKQNGITLDNLSGYSYFKGHRNVAMAVLAGDADAGAVKEEVFFQFRKMGLRSLAATPAISEHLFITRSNLDPLLVEQISTLLLDISRPADVVRILKPIKKSLTGLVGARDSDYDSLRDLVTALE